MCQCGRYRALGRLFLPHITADAFNAASFGERLDAGFNIGCDNAAAPLAQAFNGAAADVSRCSSDQGNFVLKVSLLLLTHGEPAKRQEMPSETMKPAVGCGKWLPMTSSGLSAAAFTKRTRCRTPSAGSMSNLPTQSGTAI